MSKNRNLNLTPLSNKEMHEYGYLWDGMVALELRDALTVFKLDLATLYKLYYDDTEGMVDSLSEVYEWGKNNGLFGIELEEWEEIIK